MTTAPFFSPAGRDWQRSTRLIVDSQVRKANRQKAAARRLGNLRHDPRIDVLAVDPVNPMRYVEIRGTATLQEISDDQSKLGPLKEHAEKYALPEEAARIPAGVHVAQIRITPHKVNYFDRQRSQMGPATQQVRPGDPQRTGPSRESSCLTGEDVAGDTSLPSRSVER
ncbi:pyridoxamine 5'-phosphate oxidase family protein [Mycolicibacterium madagascariense]|uniref:hypothetical protein n=1 Tax=Mycolicibacterium madagascariense TaxID=212765 RepID=UPI0021F371CE|nr:hypothetical protein [Mycolicibacterium madagascariense]MCV7015226.1 hypothetical protein [Mycolicibacterium madagascariense]